MTELIVCIVLGVVSFIMAQIISVSQIISLFRTKNTSGVSIWTYLIFIIAGIFCLAWGFSYYFKNMMTPEAGGFHAPYEIYQWGIIPILCYYITDLSMSTTMFIIKFNHMRLAKKLNMSELDLAKYLRDKQNDKYLKSGRKFYNHINFPIILLLGFLLSVVILFATLFSLYCRPHTATEKPNWPWVAVLSMLAAVLWEAISWPQFIKSIRQKDTSGISLMWAIFMPVSLTVSFAYALALACKTVGVPDEGFSYDTIGALVFNGMIVNYGILVIKCLNRRKAKKLGMTEVEYTKQVLIPAWKKKEAEKAAKKAAKAK